MKLEKCNHNNQQKDYFFVPHRNDQPNQLTPDSYRDQPPNQLIRSFQYRLINNGLF
jgi:hypothetical protein